MAEKPHQRKGVKLRSRAVKIVNLTIAGVGTYPASSRQILSKIATLSRLKSREKSLKTGGFT